MSLYVGHTERQWFLRDLRNAVHRCDDEEAARAELADYTEQSGPGGVILWRDVTTGPLVEAEQ